MASPERDRDMARLILRTYSFAWPHWPLIALCLVFSASYAALEVYYLKLIQPFVEAFTDKRPQDGGVNLAIVQDVARQALWLVVPVALTSWLSEYMQGVVVWKIVVDIRDAICRALLPQAVSYFDERRGGEFISRVSNDVNVTQKSLTFIFGEIYELPVKLVLALGIAVAASWQLSLFVLLLVPILVVPLNTFGRKIRRASRKGLESMADVTDALAQMFNGIRIVKAFQMEDAEVEEFSRLNMRFYRNMRRAARNRAHGRGIVEAVVRAFMALVVFVAGPMVAHRYWGLSVGRLAMFVAGIWFAYDPLRKLIRCYNGLQEASAGAERIFEIIDLQPAIEDPPDAVDLPAVREGVRFERVTFAYGDEAVLKDIDFEVRRGQTVAIVGRSGAGKSSLVSLLLRFYVPQQGAVRIDGHDVRRIRRKSLLDRVAVVAQQTFLFNRSVAENIRYGRRDATDDEVHAAARAANIHDFIEALPDGYATPVGEFGVKLSGGQRQRIAIARAILKNADILVLDEAMAGLDAESETAVREALFGLMKGRTTFVITHDLQTIQHADRIFVLEQGQLAQQGVHDELVSQPGEYAQLYQRQIGAATGSP